MVSFTVRMRFDEGDREKVAEILRALGPASRAEPGCVSYIPHFVEGEPATVLIYEQYVDEAALDAHQNSAHFREYGSEGFFRLMRAQQIKYLDAIV